MKYFHERFFMTETENIKAPTKTILAALDTGEYDAESSMDELEELAKTANAETVARMRGKTVEDILG